MAIESMTTTWDGEDEGEKIPAIVTMAKGSKGRCCTFSQIRSVAVYFLSRKVGEGTDVLSGKIKKCCVFGGPSGGIRRYICPCASEREKGGGSPNWTSARPLPPPSEQEAKKD